MRRVKIIGNWLMVMGALLVSVPATAQIFGATQQEEQQAFGATAPGAAFQSTSTMSGSGSTYSANPELNADGTAAYGGASYAPAKSIRRPGGVRKDGEGFGDETTYGDNQDGPSNPDPLGDAVLPLMLIACAYAIYKVRSRRKGQIVH